MCTHCVIKYVSFDPQYCQVCVICTHNIVKYMSFVPTILSSIFHLYPQCCQVCVICTHNVDKHLSCVPTILIDKYISYVLSSMCHVNYPTILAKLCLPKINHLCKIHQSHCHLIYNCEDAS